MPVYIQILIFPSKIFFFHGGGEGDSLKIPRIIIDLFKVVPSSYKPVSSVVFVPVNRTQAIIDSR